MAELESLFSKSKTSRHNQIGWSLRSVAMPRHSASADGHHHLQPDVSPRPAREPAATQLPRAAAAARDPPSPNGAVRRSSRTPSPPGSGCSFSDPLRPMRTLHVHSGRWGVRGRAAWPRRCCLRERRAARGEDQAQPCVPEGASGALSCWLPAGPGAPHPRRCAASLRCAAVAALRLRWASARMYLLHATQRNLCNIPGK